MTELTEWLRAERARRGLSQAELANLAGIPHRSYQRLEAGDPGARLTTLLRACGTLGLELNSSSSRRPTLDELSAIYDNEAAP
jgi:transcriptional regulator with XRE-family HTH domain